jgi:hypothetical protein
MRLARALSFVFLLVAFSLPGEAARVKSDYDSDADFSEYKTYFWKGRVKGETPDEAPDNPLADKRIRKAVENELQEKGYVPAEAGDADLIVYYHVAVKENTKLYVSDYGRPRRWGRYGEVDVVQYTEGTLILDIVDAAAKQLVWRGWAVDTLGNPEKMEKKINKAVSKLMKKFPPK